MIYRVFKFDSQGKYSPVQEYKSLDAAKKKIAAMIKREGPDSYNDYDYECVYPAQKVKVVNRE